MPVQRYDEVMKFPAAGLAGVLAAAAVACSGQVTQPPDGPPPLVRIEVPREVASKGVWIRYRLAGEELGGWIQPHPGLSSYTIRATVDGRPADGIRALIYAPGCAVQTLDLPLSGPISPQFFYECRPVGNVSIIGRFDPRDRLFQREVKLQVKYVARWATTFLGLADQIVVDIPVGDGVYLPAEGYFRLPVPELSKDPLAGKPDRPGEFQIWARDGKTGDLLALLTPLEPAAMRTRKGGLRIESAYPAEVVFAACKVVGSPLLHDAHGFAIRPEPGHPCEVHY